MNSTSFSLLEKLRQPADQEAWARFVQLYTPLLFYWAGRLGLQDQDAADLVQEIFLLLLRKLPEFRYDRQRTFRGWLRTVTLNKCREQQRRKTGLPPQEDGDVPEPLVADATVELTEAEYRQHLVARALQLMQSDFAPVTWKACWECVVADRPAGEVAAELGISVGTVYAAKSRVLARLRQELDGLLD